MRQTFFQVIGALILTTTSFFCAGQGPPSGGPVDRIPPEIIYSYPAVRSLHFNDKKFSLTFSKYVDRRSVEESIFISPSVGELTFDWGGTDVGVHFSDSLRPHTTYVITIGTDVVDTRNRNRMAKAYALPFSTGEQIDTASLSGKVFDTKPEGVMIFAYQLTSRNPDTLNPMHLKPDYLTQTGKDGLFTLPYLAFGTYRLIAVRDEFKNLFYDRETDQFGVPVSDFVLSDTLPFIAGIQFQMTSEDTTPPFLSSARSLDRSHVLLRFNEPMDTAQIGIQNVMVVDTSGSLSLPLYDFSFVDNSAFVAQLITAPQESLKVYRVTLTGFRDRQGNAMIIKGNNSIFSGSITSDTTRPFIQTTNISDSTKRIEVNDTLHFLFSEAIHKSVFEYGFHLQDSVGNNVSGKFLWWSSTAVSFIPSAPLLWNARYKVKISMDSVEDFSGNHLKDSLKILPFRTVDDKTFGSIKGVVVDEMRNAKGNIYLNIIDASKKDARLHQEILEKPGLFEVDRIAEGKYLIFAFRDSDGNGVYTFGNVVPFHPSERFVVYADTLKVRARWTVEGVTIRFK